MHQRIVVWAVVSLLVVTHIAQADDFDDAAAARRWYVSGIVGASFMTLTSGGENTIPLEPTQNTGAITGGAFTGGGSLGLAIPATGGQWRLEMEGRQRARLSGQTTSVGEPFFYDVQAKDGWSVTGNLWRDIAITDHIDLYAGGGIGGGGYRLSVDDQIYSAAYSQVSAFAWQAGGGVVWNPSNRLAIDLGYRFFAVGTGHTALVDTFSGGSAGVYTSALSASEVLLTFRLYEPLAILRSRR